MKQPIARQLFKLLALSITLCSCEHAGNSNVANKSINFPNFGSSDIPKPRESADTRNFLESLGVCAHVSRPNTPYENLQAVRQELQYLKIKLIRDDMFSASLDKQLKTIQTLAQDGIKFDIIFSPKHVPDPSEFTNYFIKLSPFLKYIEGPNEVDNVHKKMDFETEAKPIFQQNIDYQRKLYDTVKSLPQLNKIPVLVFTSVYGHYNENVRSLIENKIYEDRRPIADFDNVHSYDLWGEGAQSQRNTPFCCSHLPNLRTVITETGYSNITYSDGNNGSKMGVTPEPAAKLLLNSIFFRYRQGVHSIFIYELLDNAPDPDNLDKEKHFGLFDLNNAPKPAAIALHNLRSILYASLTDAPASDNEAASLNLKITESNNSPEYAYSKHHLLLHSSPKTHFLALWADGKVWDFNQHQPFNLNASNKISIELPTNANRISIYNPLIGETPISSVANTNKIVAETIDAPILVKIEL